MGKDAPNVTLRCLVLEQGPGACPRRNSFDPEIDNLLDEDAVLDGKPSNSPIRSLPLDFLIPSRDARQDCWSPASGGCERLAMSHTPSSSASQKPSSQARRRFRSWIRSSRCSPKDSSSQNLSPCCRKRRQPFCASCSPRTPLLDPDRVGPVI